MRVAVLSFAHERAGAYARLLRDMPGVDLVTADPGAPADDPDRGRALADRLAVSYVDDWDAVFATRPHAVVVTAEVDRRRELVERAAEAEAFVLCEYPPAAEEVDVHAMVDACDIGGVGMVVASPALASDAFATVRRGIADGVVGTLTTVHGACHRLPPVSGGTSGDPGAGALGAEAACLLDLVDAVLGGEPAAQVYAQTGTVLSGRSDVESSALLTVRYAGGVVASFDCGWSVAPAAGPAVTFVGDRASIEFTPVPRLLDGYDAATSARRWEPGGADPCRAVLDGLIASVDGGPAAGPDGAAALRTMRILDAARESARTGQPVDLG